MSRVFVTTGGSEITWREMASHHGEPQEPKDI
jgi:hypothetical protein